jgi:hypothetical protein
MILELETLNTFYANLVDVAIFISNYSSQNIYINRVIRDNKFLQ